MLELLTYFSIYLASTVKFILGPSMGVAGGISWPVTALLTTAGGVSTTGVFLYFMPMVKKLARMLRKKEPKTFSKKNRRLVKAWNSFGLLGVSFLTPILFSPIGGAILVSSFGNKKKAITLMYMAFGTFFWAALFALFFDELKNHLPGLSAYLGI